MILESFRYVHWCLQDGSPKGKQALILSLDVESPQNS